MLSNSRLKFLRVQGYFNHSDKDISEMAFGNRFAFILCTTFVAYGLFTANLNVLGSMTIVAFGGIILPYHPFDYIYNYILRNPLRKPKLPPRSPQLKFACLLATLFLACTTFLFYCNYTLGAYIVGGLLLIVASLVSLSDLCIPSYVYNYFFKINIDR